MGGKRTSDGAWKRDVGCGCNRGCRWQHGSSRKRRRHPCGDRRLYRRARECPKWVQSRHYANGSFGWKANISDCFGQKQSLRVQPRGSSVNSSSKARLKRRLTSYWKLEAANVVILPALAVTLVLRAGDEVSLPVVIGLSAASLLLIVGAAAWRMALAELDGNHTLVRRLLPWLAEVRWPTLVLSGVAVLAASAEIWADGGWSPSAIAASISAALAALEWVNYYRVQLQHFDHMADLRRLVSGHGFREAYLAKAIRRWEAANSAR